MNAAFSSALAIARYHIVLIAITAQLAFSKILVGRAQPWVALVCAVDWFLINLMNRITDIDEDLRNGIPGTELVARRKKLLTALAVFLLVGSFVTTHYLWPRLTPWRVAVQVVGLGYNYRIVPTPGGLRRFKEIYFLKNFLSAMLFVATCFAYPLVTAPGALVMGRGAVLTLILFFVPFEITYEILYDLRDLEGDRVEGIPTYPVMHGVPASLRVIDVLLLVSSGVLVVGFFAGAIGVREAMMVFAPVVQRVFYPGRVARGLTSRDCVLLTHLGSAQLGLFLIGTRVWTSLGLPWNVFIR